MLTMKCFNSQYTNNKVVENTMRRGTYSIKPNLSYTKVFAFVLHTVRYPIARRQVFTREEKKNDRKQRFFLHLCFGTGADTLRCLALATVDEPIPPSEMDLEASEKFAGYEVGNL